MAATNCNGSPDYCQLPFDRYTFAGTHNSAAYRLRPDCTLATGKCSKAIGTCIEAGSKCTQPWRERCRTSSENCKNKIPPWLGRWTHICKVPLQACAGSMPIICENAPQWFTRCLWENQPGKDIGQQLIDGIRSLDMDTCVTHDQRAVTCHGQGATRALGDELDVHLRQLADFLGTHRDQVVTIEYMDTDGDAGIIARALVAAVERHLGGRLWEQQSANAPWPTLGQMIDAGKQVVVFAGSIYEALPAATRPRWLHRRDDHYRNTWDYTRSGHTPDEIARLMLSYQPTGPDADHWQCVDFEYSPDGKTLLDQMRHGTVPSVCLERLASDMNRRVPEIVEHYARRFRQIHRVRLDYYDNAKTLLFDAVTMMNARNFRLFALKKHANTLSRRATSRCNGDAALCDRPLNRITFAGTHNSAAYHLAPECSRQIATCDRVMQRTAQQCTSSLPDALSFLSVFCTAWQQVCTATERVCRGWQQVCTRTIDVCARGLSWMCDAAPDWLKDCVWQNQAGHDITQQLNDGIRALDVDVCMDRNEQVVVCHGMGELRALGDTLEHVLGQIRSHLETVPDTVITIEFGDVDGDGRSMAIKLRDIVQAQLGRYLVERPKGDSAAVWPTLGQLIDKQQRVVVFGSGWTERLAEEERPAWLLSRGDYFVGSWSYTHQQPTTDGAATVLHEHANATHADDNRMPCIDME
ncbi:PLC-like phosphodiesterase [Syncephalis pseudoplumigaleata]|uniref:PLC-like phosphodiesterase n=1 Tax=Syncephalis pseudoplumigaleata TaxID=1712513 RepID=A0A4P9Z116_9FUNG|nr:PLC-like phosphodiesterase [Syncephalis pseudoplumigaleata]|eukprot:RKP25602.1 PLC-like phosphodiesterase [Syncephalis pseudoplumigaleata]